MNRLIAFPFCSWTSNSISSPTTDNNLFNADVVYTPNSGALNVKLSNWISPNTVLSSEIKRVINLPSAAFHATDSTNPAKLYFWMNRVILVLFILTLFLNLIVLQRYYNFLIFPNFYGFFHTQTGSQNVLFLTSSAFLKDSSVYLPSSPSMIAPAPALPGLLAISMPKQPSYSPPIDLI